ncbi:MAG TPA: lysophospholipid acyltransferase family protein [Pyrinomonadaceae bacterium]|nr:lysophospholipid acyltransferase family protein [Pyrinomonadaceae bacterium]
MAKKGSTQIWLEFLVVRMALGVLRVLPRRVAMSIGVNAGGLAYHVLGKLRRIGLRNLELAYPEKTAAEREAVLRSAFGNLGRVMAVVSRFSGLDRNNLEDLIEYTPTDVFAAAYQQTKTEGRGRIILGGHMGNWELQAFSYPIFFEPLSFLARRMDNPRIEETVRAIRTRLGNKQIDKVNAAGPILRVLRAGGTVGVLADVNSHPKEGVFVPFFGIPACTATGIAMLAARANAAIVPMFAIWDQEKKKYKIVHGDIIEPVNTGNRQADIEQTTALCVAATERVIRDYPDQWIWIHRRWKTRPPGEKELY